MYTKPPADPRRVATCFAVDARPRSKPPNVCVKVLHPRGGEPGDGAQEAVVSEIMRAWDMIDTKVSQRVACCCYAGLFFGVNPRPRLWQVVSCCQSVWGGRDM